MEAGICKEGIYDLISKNSFSFGTLYYTALSLYNIE